MLWLPISSRSSFGPPPRSPRFCFGRPHPTRCFPTPSFPSVPCSPFSFCFPCRFATFALRPSPTKLFSPPCGLCHAGHPRPFQTNDPPGKFCLYKRLAFLMLCSLSPFYAVMETSVDPHLLFSPLSARTVFKHSCIVFFPPLSRKRLGVPL